MLCVYNMYVHVDIHVELETRHGEQCEEEGEGEEEEEGEEEVGDIVGRERGEVGQISEEDYAKRSKWER